MNTNPIFKESLASKPSSCVINVYPFCTFKCKMCLIWTRKDIIKDIKPLPFEIINKLITTLAEFSGQEARINFIGGEPLLRSDIVSLVKLCSDIGLWSGICTNGYFADENKIRCLAEAGLSSLSISLDSLNKKTHDMLRGKSGSYERIMYGLENASKFISEKFKVSIQTTIMRQNLDDILELAKWAQKNQVICSIRYAVITQPFYITTNGDDWYKKSPHDWLWPQDVKKIYDVIDNLIRLKTQQGYFKIVNSIPQLKAFKSYFENPEKFLKKSSCNLGNYALNVHYNGDVNFCYELGVIGNIFKSSIKDMWFSSEAEEIRRKMKDCDKNCNYLINSYREETIDESELNL